MRSLTVEELLRWEEHGARWRVTELQPERVVVEMCTCHGEPVDLRQGQEPELLEFVHSRRAAMDGIGED